MALIDKETIRAEIERRKKEHLETAVSSPIYGAKFAEDCEILAFLDTLLEQPKLKPMNIPSAGGGMSTTPPKFKLDVKPEQLIGLNDENAADKKAVKEIVKTVHKEVTRQVKEVTRQVKELVGKQPVEGLDKARFLKVLDQWEEHAVRGMRNGATAYHQGKIALITDLRDWINREG